MLCSAVEDDRSPVNMTYCVGTYTGGCDVIKDRELSGTTTVTEVMHRVESLLSKLLLSEYKHTLYYPDF